MRRLVIYLVIFVLALLAMIVAPSLVGEEGYVLISLGLWTFETTVVYGVFILLITGFAVYLLAKLILKSLGMMKGSSRWLGTWGSRKKQAAFERGLHAMIQGDFLAAREHMKNTESGDFDGVNYLVAAQAAKALGEVDKVDYLLNRAAESPAAEYTVQIIRARHAIEANDAKSALRYLDNVDENKKHTAAYKKLYASALAAAGEFEKLEGLLKPWKKALGNEYQHWQQQIAKGRLSEVASKQGAIQLDAFWQSLPRAQRNDNGYRAAYIEQLLAQGMHQNAERYLLEWQKKSPDNTLLPLMAKLQLANPASAIKRLENWIKQDSDNAELYSILGQIAYRANDFVLAEKALQKAVSLSPSPTDLQLLAAIKEHESQPDQALALYKQSIGSRHE